MELKNAKNLILELLKKDGKATNSAMLRVLEGDNNILQEVREELIMDNLAKDKENVGLIYNEAKIVNNVKTEEKKSERNQSATDDIHSQGNAVFLSYGRDDATEFAQQLKNDLQECGYSVWMDETGIELGGLWEVRIEAGILNSEIILALMTPYSVRQESVCRDEIIFAINNGKKVIPLKIYVQVAPTLMLSRRNWLDFTADYKIGFEKLIQYIKGEKDDLNRPVFSTITGVTPFDFSFEIANYSNNFFGRLWLNKEIEKWISETSERSLVIVGEAGIGKSAIAAWISQNRITQVASIHFCTRRNMRTLDPFEYVSALAGQLVTQIPEYYDLVKELNPENRRNNASTAFKELIVEPLQQIKTSQNTKLFIIDSLDESILQNGETILDVVSKEAANLPVWIRVICTTRPEEPILQKIRHLNAFELKTDVKGNLEDVAGYINKELKNPDLPHRLKENSVSIIAKLNSLANGNFLYAKMAIEALTDYDLPLVKLDSFHGNLSDFYLQIFKQSFKDYEEYKQRYLPLLSILLASQGPLSLDILMSALGIDLTELRLRFQPLRIYIRNIVSPDGFEVVFQHKSISDWLISEKTAGEYKAEPIFGHKLLSKALIGLWQENKYALRNLPTHLIAAQQWDDLINILCNLDFIQAKAAAKMTYVLVKDFNDALEAIPDNAAEVAKEKARQSRMDKYTRDLISCAKGEVTIDELEIPESITPWTEEQINAEIERIKTNPNRADRLKSFNNFLGQEANNLQNNAHQFAHFTTQQAWNFAADGPVGKAVKKQPQDKIQGLLLKTQVTRLAWNALPQVLKILKGHTDDIRAVNVTPDGKRAISGSKDMTCIIWDLESGRAIKRLKGHTHFVKAVCVTPDGKFAISGSGDKTCIVWDLFSGQPLKMLRGHKKEVRAVGITPDGKLAISGSKDMTCIVWDVESGQALKTLHGHTNAVISLSMTPNGKLAVSGSADKTCIFWNLESGMALKTLNGHTGLVKATSITTDGKRAVSGSTDRTCIIWNLENGRLSKRLQGHSRAVDTVSVTPDGIHLVSGSADKNFIVWDIESGQVLKTFQGHTKEIRAVSITPDVKQAVSGSSDNTLIVWDIESGQALKRLQGHSRSVESVSVMPDGKYAVSGSRDRTCFVWDLDSGRPLKMLEGHIDAVEAVSITPDGKYVVSGSRDKTCIVWDIQHGRALKRLEGHKDDVIAVSVTPDGKYAISGSEDLTCIVWDIKNGRALKTLKGHTGWIHTLSIALDSNCVISGSADNTCIVWDLDSGEAFKRLQGHTDDVIAVCVSPDGNYAISGSADNTCIVWDLDSGEALKRLQGHTDRVCTVSITPNGKRAVSGSEDGSLIVWNIETGEQLAKYYSDAQLKSAALFSGGIFSGFDTGQVSIINADIDLPSPSKRINPFVITNIFKKKRKTIEIIRFTPIIKKVISYNGKECRCMNCHTNFNSKDFIGLCTSGECYHTNSVTRSLVNFEFYMAEGPRQILLNENNSATTYNVDEKWHIKDKIKGTKHICPVCNQKFYFHACPHCRHPMPRLTREDLKNTIAPAGIRSSGKTTYMTVLMHQLVSKALIKPNLTVISNFKEIENYKDFAEKYDELFKNKSLLQPTQVGEIPRPYLLRTITQQKKKEEKKTYTLWYDFAGGSFEDGSVKDAVSKYFSEVSGILLFIDPTNSKELVKLIKVEPNYPKGADVFRDHSVLQKINTVLFRGTENKKVLKEKLFAIVITKVDIFSNKSVGHFDEESVIWEPSPHNAAGGFCIDDFDRVNKEVKNYIIEYHNEIYNQIVGLENDDASNIGYFAVSSLGHSPVSDSCMLEHPIEPLRIEDPFYWFLYKIGHLPGTDRNPFIEKNK